MTDKCVSCKKELTGGTDTFGDPPNNLCWDCYSALMWEGNTEVTYNFVGPGYGEYFRYARISYDYDDESF